MPSAPVGSSSRSAPPTTLGLDVGGTKLAAVVLDGGGRILAEARTPTRAAEGVEAVIGRCVALLAGLRGQHPACAAVGVGLAGLVQPETGLVRSSVILPGWSDVPLADRLGAALGLPCVLDNDATAAGWGEFVALGSPPHLDLLLLTVGTGIGAALVLGGRLQRGAAGLAGEAGHMVVRSVGGALCLCGRRGCLHTLASGSALTARARELAAQHPGSALAARGPVPGLDEVAVLAEAGDALARQVVLEGAAALATGVANLAQLLNPARISLCGGVLGLGHLYLEVLRREVQAQVFAEVWDALDIAPAQHGSLAGAHGAACLARAAVPPRGSPGAGPGRGTPAV